MSKFNNGVVTTLKSYFNAGDQPTEAQFAELIQDIQNGIDEHDHAGLLDGDGKSELAFDEITSSGVEVASGFYFTEGTLVTEFDGNFIVTGGNIDIENGAWVGCDASNSWVFDSTDDNVTTLADVGIGTDDPAYHLDVNYTARVVGSGDVYPAIHFERTDGVSWTDRHWQFVLGTSGAFVIQDSTASANRLIINTDGDVGIGTDDPSTTFHVQGVTTFEAATPLNVFYENDATDYWWRMGVDSGNFLFDYDDDQDGNFTPYTRVLALYNNGDVIVFSLGGSGNDDLYVDNNGKLINDPSERRFKQNIVQIEGALNMVCSLRGVEYDWNKDELGDICDPGDRRQLGLIAEEVEEIVPLAVNYSEQRGYKSLCKTRLIPILVEAIKELSDKVEKLEAK